jgi:hypothetical protein
MKRIFYLLIVFFSIGHYCFADSFNFVGRKWYELGGDAFYTTCNTLDDLRELGKIFDFDIDKPSDIIFNLRNEPVKTEWDDFCEGFYSDLVNRNLFTRGTYFIKIWSDPDGRIFKQNGMSTFIEIIKVRDNSFARVYKSQKTVTLSTQLQIK